MADSTIYFVHWFTDGSSTVKDGVGRAGAAVTTEDKVIWAQALPQGTSAQKAELVALTQALRWGKNKELNIYTDSRYAFATIHVHAAIYRERGLLTAEGKTVKNKEEILSLLEAVWLPKKVAVIHCKGHQKLDSPIAKGNHLADKTAKEVSFLPISPLTLLPLKGFPTLKLPETPIYSSEEESLAKNKQARKDSKGWWILPGGQIVLPANLGHQLIKQLHSATHLGGTRLYQLAKSQFFFPQLRQLTEQTALRCPACAHVNPSQRPRETPGTRYRGLSPGEHWEIDFTEIKPPQAGYKYLLVLVDTFSGWVEAKISRSETAQVVARF